MFDQRNDKIAIVTIFIVIYCLFETPLSFDKYCEPRPPPWEHQDRSPKAEIFMGNPIIIYDTCFEIFAK